MTDGADSVNVASGLAQVGPDSAAPDNDNRLPTRDLTATQAGHQDDVAWKDFRRGSPRNPS